MFQTRARSDSLNRCLQALRPQGTVIDLAFYQGGMDGARLGEEFHHNGLSIRCAQINRMPRQLAHAWDQRRLAQETLHLLADEGDLIREHMITHVVPYDDAPGFLRHLVADRPGHDLRYALDYTRTREELGWHPQYTDLRAGLADTIDWYRANEAWWRPDKAATEASYARTGQ